MLLLVAKGINVSSTAFLSDLRGTGSSFNYSSESRTDRSVRFRDLGYDFRLQPTYAVNIKRPVVFQTAPNGYTQSRGGIVQTIPFSLLNGKITNNTISISTSFDIEISTAEKDQLLYDFCLNVIGIDELRRVLTQNVLPDA